MHTYTMVSTYHCHELHFLLQCNDGLPPIAFPMWYRVFGLKPAHYSVYCQVWYSVVITEFLFERLTDLFEQLFIVREINLNQVATLFKGKNHFKRSVQTLLQTRVKHLCH